MDTSGSDEHNTSLESNFSDEGDHTIYHRVHRPSPFTLRSQCKNPRCPQGAGIYFRSRISPSPSKQRVRTRRRRRSDQSHLDSSANTSLTSPTTTFEDHHHYHNHHHHHHHAESSAQETILLRSGEMIRQRSRTPRRRKETSERVETPVSREGSSWNGGVGSLEVNGGVGGIVVTVKDKVLGFFTPKKEASLPAIVESSESGFEEGNLTGGTVPTSSPASDVFVGAREFFEERETRERLTSDYWSSTDTPSRIRESTKRLSIRKPFNHYIAYSSDEELEEWQNEPRSDYTYSASLTYRDRVTPDRKIGSPNMARRGLRGGNTNYIKSPDFSSSDLSFDTDDSSQLNLRTRTILRPMDALSDTSDGETEAVVEPVSRRTRSSRSRSIDVAPRVNGSTVTRTVTSSTYTTTRTLHRGLDVDSDVDDGTESAIPRRATPLTARSGTPLARAGTPASRANSRSSVAGDGVGRGYTLAKGAIAEDVEEEEAETESILTWRTLSWRSVKRITTYVTTSVVMMAVRTMMAQQSSSTDSTSTLEKLSKHSFVSRVSSSSRRVIGAGADVLASSREYIRKRPVLIWIPLIPLLILLALIASWWLFQSGAKTGDSADPTQTTQEPSFLSYTLSTASEITNLVINGIYYTPILAWEAATGAVGWVMSMCSVGLSALWFSVTSMATWLWSVAHAGLVFILQTLYLILDFLQIVALAVVSFFSSSVSYVFGFLLPNTTTNGSEVTHSEAQSWSAFAWVSRQASLEWVSQAYESVSESAQKAQTSVWEGWLWLVISVADLLTAGVSSVLWLLSSVWSLIWYLISGLWTVLVYIFTGTVGLISSVSAGVTSSVVEVSSSVAGSAQMLFLPLFKSSKAVEKEENTLHVAQSSSIDGSSVNVAGVSVEDVVSRVLRSKELEAVITSISSQNIKNQPASEDIHLIVKSIVEGELQEHKEETAAMWESQSKTLAEERKSHMLSVEEKHSTFLMQLGLLEGEVARLQGSVKVGQDGHEEHQQRLELLSDTISKLSLQLRELENNHTTLAAEVKSCCKNTSVTLADVERHVTTLLGDILGLSSGKKEGEADTWSVADMGAWLRSYFVAKEELETRLNILTTTLQRKSLEDNDIKESTLTASNAAVAQSTQIIMDTVLEKLRAEILKQHEQQSEAVRQQMSLQVNDQMKAAASVLGQQMSEQVEHELQSSKQQLHNIVSVAVQEAVPEHVASAVPEAVNNAVSKVVAHVVPEAVATAVPDVVKVAVDGAVGTAVNAAVNIAVDEAVAAAVPDAVNVAVPEVVNIAVAQAVPEAIQEALPEAVNNVVQESMSVEIQGAVNEVVASVVPSIVSSTVNESVASRISEALVDAGLGKAGSTKAETSGNGVVVIGGTHADMSSSSSSSSASIISTVNVSNNGNNGSNPFPPVSLPMTTGLNESAVARIVKEALLKYDADKTGMVDYALETAGGNIISTRCTESYRVNTAEMSILGISLFTYPTSNNPRIVIQPERMPGQCWAFKGSQGYIVISLAGNVLPTGFTMEHIPKSLSSSGDSDSAPREFEVWGLLSENDEGFFLGNYEYDRDGDPFQFFPVKEVTTEYFPMVELKINSNYGNVQYTCLYRFRVHGVRNF